MAGSRAADAREPGQVREEAALSDTVRAPRTSLAGANGRRARPGADLEGGCTVHLPIEDFGDKVLARRLALARTVAHCHRINRAGWEDRST
jgi:hypothetical protein